MRIRWLLRAYRWVRNPPSPLKMKVVLGVIGVALLIGAIEHWIGWPEWLTPSNEFRGRWPR